MLNPTATELQAVIVQLDQAIFKHERWSEALAATLACRVPCDERDLRDDASRLCPFVQGLYGDGQRLLAAHPSLPAIASEHGRMHEFAARFLRSSAAASPSLSATMTCLPALSNAFALS